MRKYITALALSLCTVTLNAQDSYPDSAHVVGITRFWAATGEASGNRVSVRDSQGDIHVVYCYRIGGPYADSGEVFHVFSTDNGISWSYPENISQTDTCTSTEPNLVIDSRDRLHCVWKQLYIDTATTYYDYDMYYSQHDSTGWTQPVNISNLGLGANGCYSSLVVDSEDHTHVVYDMSTGSGNWDVFYSYYNDSIWSVPYQVSNTPYDDAFPALAIDHVDNLHLVWRQLTTNAPIFYSMYDGNAWSTPEEIANFTTGQSAYPCIVADSNNNPRVLWSWGNLPGDSSDIYITIYDGSNWSAPLNLSNTVNPSGYSSLAIDSLDNLYVVWSEKTAAMNREIYYRYYNGFTWSNITNLSQNSQSSDVPKLSNPVKSNCIDLIWVNDYINPISQVLYLTLPFVGLEDITKSDVTVVDVHVHPNPYKHTITIKYSLTASDLITIAVYDICGRLVGNIRSGVSPAGNYQITWTASALPAGVYFIEIVGSVRSTVKKIIKIQ
jgi:hypothetical protein